MSDTRLRYSIQQGNIYHVPAMPYRLAFAMVVRKAIDELAKAFGPLSRRDVIAVAWPEAIKRPVLETLEEWRHVASLSQGSRPDKDLQGPHLRAVLVGKAMKEAFVLTPCDALMEAVRFATDKDIPTEFVNRNPTPGNLLSSPCSPSPDMWADDWFAVSSSIRDYLELTEESIQRYPWR